MAIVGSKPSSIKIEDLMAIAPFGTGGSTEAKKCNVDSRMAFAISKLGSTPSGMDTCGVGTIIPQS